MYINDIAIAKTVLYLYFALAPVYVFSSGLPQPADMIAALLLFPWCLVNLKRVPHHLHQFILIFAFFVFWTFFVSSIQAFYSQEPIILRGPAFYLFCFLFTLAIAVLYGSLPYYRLLRFFQQLVLVSALTSVLLYGVLLTEGSGRFPGSFNNPNQLGYHGLLLVCFCMICAWGGRPSKWLVGVNIALSAWLVFFSFSLTAAGTLVLACLGGGFLFFSKVIKLNWRVFIWGILGCVVFFSVVVSSNSLNSLISGGWEKRIQRMDGKIKGVYEARNYDRLREYPQYMVFGAGEGAVGRFKPKSGGNEIHSSIGTVLFCYGIVGLFLLLLLTKEAVWGGPLGIHIIIAALYAYGTLHHGLRQPLFWTVLLVGVITVHNWRSANQKAFK